jgi:dipeptidyl aminopeptidase/acylaminoacyl peptidase
MSASKRNLAIGLAALAVLAIAAALFLRGGNPRTHVTRQDLAVAAAPESATAAPPPSAPQPTPEQSARKGQIYFHRELSLSKIIPGEGIVTRLADLAEKGLVPYQIQSARLSPDATRMAYGNAVVRDVGNGLFGSFPPEAIFLRDVATSKPGEKVASLEGSEIHAFFWSRDSAHVALTSWDADQGIRNWVVDVATKALHELKLPIRHAADGKAYALAIAAWAPGGNWFAAGDEELLYLVEIKNRTGPVWSWSGRKRLTKDPHQILGGTCFFSPDGGKVLFVTVDEGARMALLTAEIEGGEERLLVASGGFTDLYACWSPDGKRIAFSGARLDASGKRAGQSGIYVIPADGSSEPPAPVLEEFHPPEQFRLRLVDWR